MTISIKNAIMASNFNDVQMVLQNDLTVLSLKILLACLWQKQNCDEITILSEYLVLLFAHSVIAISNICF